MYAVEAPVSFLTFSPDGKYFAAADGNTVTISAARAGQPGSWNMKRMLAHEGEIYGLAFSRDSQYIAMASADNTTRVWDLASGQEVARHTASNKKWASLAFGPNDKYLAVTNPASILNNSGSNDSHLWRWSPEDLRAEARTRLAPNLTAADCREYEDWRRTVFGQDGVENKEPSHKVCPNPPAPAPPSP
jgi:WD40 repeat protein